VSTPAGTGIKDPPQTLWGILSSIGPGLILSANMGGIAQALMLPFLGFAAVWCRRRIAPSLAAGPAWTACLLLSTLAMAVVGLFQAGQQTGLWRALSSLK
jgi:hypothetical protein